MGWSLSIDLGTTNTVAAVRYGDAVPTELSLVPHGGLSSAVFLSAASVYVGEAAWEHAEEDPAAFYPSPKRLLMQTSRDHMYSLAPIFAAIYREVYSKAYAECGPEMPDKVVLTHPAALSERAKSLITGAAADAGIDKERIVLVPEPVAAAAYCYREAEVPDQLLIVDVGGGTCDTAVIRFDSSGAPRIIAADGDNGLGGRTFDGRLGQLLAKKIDDGVLDPETLRAFTSPEILRKITQARENLSVSDNCALEFGPELGAASVTREEFESAIRSDIDRIITLGRRSLGSQKPDLSTHIFLTGGTSLTPAVQSSVSDLGTLRSIEAPFSAVSLGALSLGSLTDVEPGRKTGVDVKRGGLRENARGGPTAESTGRKEISGMRIFVMVTATVALVALVSGLILLNRNAGTPETEISGSSGSAEENFDPSPIVPVVLSSNSPLLDGENLACSGVMEVAGLAAVKEVKKSGEPHSSGAHGMTSCTLGTELQVALSLETFRPFGFSQFISYRRQNSGGSIEAVRSLPGWYVISADWTGWEFVCLFVKDIGWLSVSVKDKDVAGTDLALHIAEALDPVLEIQNR